MSTSEAGEDQHSIMPLRVFLCHSSEDKAAVRDLYRRLESSGVKPWLDENDLLPGQDWEREIASAVQATDVALICLSRNSLNKAGYIQREIRYALDIADQQPAGTIFLIPLRLESCDVPDRLRQWQWVSLFEQSGYKKLVLSLSVRAKALERLPPKTLSDEDDGVEAAFNLINPRFTFAAFVVGSCNQFACGVARSVAEHPAGSYTPLFIHGGVGMGKTHLAHAIAHEVQSRSPESRIIYTSSERFMNQMITGIRTDRTHQFRARYRSTDILIMDDIQFFQSKESTQEEFFHLFNDLHDHRKQIVITSDSAPKELPGLVERLRSRFQWGILADIQPPDPETKLKILTLRASEEGVTLPDDVATFIASRAGSNIRELEGALIRLVAYSSITGTQISIEMAFDVLSHLVHGEERKATIQTIQKMVADRFGLSISDLKQKASSKRVAFPRMVAMYLVKELTSASLPEIGRAFGGKHHSTVIHSIRRIEDLRHTDADLNRMLHGLTNSLR